MEINTLESALELLLRHAAPVNGTETVALPAALHRVAAADVRSPMPVPPFDRSPLDGYALHSADIASASRENPAAVRVIGEACAGCGERFHPGPGEAVRVMTGAPVPEECDCVIRQEDTDQGMTTALIYAPVKSGGNICRAGEDVRVGEPVLQAGEAITSAHIGVLASLGVTELEVRRPVRAALLCTGDELKQPGEPLAYGQIYDANRATLTARLSELQVDARILDSAADDPQQVADLLSRAAGEADILITTGGVSVGKKDIFHQVLPLMGAERLFWKVAMKPGSPLLCGLHQGKLVICLSGNPFAALACFELFVVPVLKRLAGRADAASRRVKAVLEGSFPKASPGRRLIRAYFDGEKVRVTGDNHSSGSLRTMIGCNCLIDIPAGSGPVANGDRVEVVLL